MTGYVEWGDAPCRGGVCYRKEKICGTYFYTVVISRGERTPEFLLFPRLKKAARELHRRGIGRAVFPSDFSYGALFERYGVLPVEVMPLFRALAPELAWSAVRVQGLGLASARIAVCGDRLTSELAWTVTQLCMRSRYILLAVPDRDGAFCRKLRREYGAALVQTEDADQIAGADACILFSPRKNLRTCHMVLRLYRAAPLPPVSLRLMEEQVRIPPECDSMQMLAVLYEAGVIRREQISVEVLSNAPGGGSMA